MVNKDVFLDTYQYFDQDVIVEIIDIFITEYPEKLEKLTQNIAQSDFKGLRFNAHNLKGVVANFSAPEALELVRNFEKNAASLVESEGEGFCKVALGKDLENISLAMTEMADDLMKIKAEIQSKK